ncbi:5-oxoprolinase subunit C family protein [Blastococcus sp. SYSU D00695]
MTRTVTVLATGPLTTVQDLGRPGRGALGVGRSGAADRAAAALANRLLGNDPDAALLEVTLGGLVLRADADLLVVTTGARCPGSPAHNAPALLPAGARLRLGAPGTGLRTCVGVRGGIAVEPVLGSRATDLLSGLGPPVVSAGDVLAVGPPSGPLPGVDLAPLPDPPGGEVAVRVLPGPRRDWFGGDAWASLTAQAWVVTAESNRVGLRLDGEPLHRARAGELPSEGMVRGALQVPPSGLPVLFLADAPVTGGYPVLAYVADADVDRCAQLRPGQVLRLRG